MFKNILREEAKNGKSSCNITVDVLIKNCNYSKRFKYELENWCRSNGLCASISNKIASFDWN